MNPAQSPEERQCPSCAEWIPTSASECDSCGHEADLYGGTPQRSDEPIMPSFVDPQKNLRALVRMVIIGGITVAVIGVGVLAVLLLIRFL